MKKSSLILTVLALGGGVALAPVAYAAEKTCYDKAFINFGERAAASVASAFVPAPVQPAQESAPVLDPDLLNIDRDA